MFDDWNEFLRLLIARRVRFLLVGGHALAVHGRPRHTEDLDVWIATNRTNAAKVRSALADFGFGSVAPSIEALSVPSKVFMLGRIPYRIDILTRIDGLAFDEGWQGRIVTRLGDLDVPVIGERELIKNKLAAGRPKDLADIALLAEVPKRARAKRASPKDGRRRR